MLPERSAVFHAIASAVKVVRSNSNDEPITWPMMKYIRFHIYIYPQIWEIAILATAKVFTTGNSQVIRLPKAFRVDATEVWIIKNDITGEIAIKPKDDDKR